jgi:hypothetical protein
MIAIGVTTPEEHLRSTMRSILFLATALSFWATDAMAFKDCTFSTGDEAYRQCVQDNENELLKNNNNLRARIAKLEAIMAGKFKIQDVAGSCLDTGDGGASISYFGDCNPGGARDASRLFTLSPQ